MYAIQFGEILDIKEFGAIGGGVTHPLSTIGALGGVSTVGWTLAQWQSAFYPFATSLNNEIDWCAFQAALNQAIVQGTGKVQILVPPGGYLFDQPATAALSSKLKLMITGSGEGSTIVVNNTTGGIILTTSDNLTVVMIEQITLLAGVQNAGIALGITGNKNSSQTRRLAIIEHCFIGSIDDSTDACFDIGVALVGVSRPLIFDVFVDQGQMATHKMTCGIQFDYCYNPAINNSEVHVRGTGGCALGISHVGDVQQGGRMYGCQAVACDTGCIIAYNAGSNEPDFHIIHCHFNANNIGIILDGVKYAWFTNNEMYCQNAGTVAPVRVTTSADWPSGKTVSVSSTAGVAVGQVVTGSANIPIGTTVVSFVANTSITVSQAVTADVPNATQLTLTTPYVDIWVRSCEGLQILNNIYRQNFQTTRYHVRLDIAGSLFGSSASIRNVLIDDRDGYFAATTIPPVYINNTPINQIRTINVTIIQSTYIASYDFASYPAWPLYTVVSGDSGATNSPNNVLAKNELPHVTLVTTSSYVADPFIDEEIVWVRGGRFPTNPD